MSTEVPRFVIFTNPETPRARLIKESFEKSRVPAVFIPWTRVLFGEIPWEQIAKEETILRIESPGKNWLVEKALLELGAKENEPDPGEGRGWRKITLEETKQLENDPGRIWPMRQWFLGWRKVLFKLEQEVAVHPKLRWMNSPENIVTMFDKAACDGLLSDCGIRVPRNLGMPNSFEDLVGRMRTRSENRIFLKPCHGSSSSGVVALEVSGNLMQAWSTIQMVETKGAVKMYNNRRVARYENAGEIRKLVDAVCSERALVQVWWPKAGWRGKRFDLRVAVIAGRASHIVPRQSSSPMTSLQLGAERGNAAELANFLGEESWRKILQTCERAFTAFPGNNYATFDVLVAPGGRRHAIGEANAFGDMLPGCLHEGMDTYGAELEAALKTTDQVSTTGQ